MSKKVYISPSDQVSNAYAWDMPGTAGHFAWV